MKLISSIVLSNLSLCDVTHFINCLNKILGKSELKYLFCLKCRTKVWNITKIFSKSPVFAQFMFWVEMFWHKVFRDSLKRNTEVTFCIQRQNFSFCYLTFLNRILFPMVIMHLFKLYLVTLIFVFVRIWNECNNTEFTDYYIIRESKIGN